MTDALELALGIICCGFIFRVGWSLAGWLLAKLHVFDVGVTVTINPRTVEWKGPHANIDRTKCSGSKGLPVGGGE